MNYCVKTTLRHAFDFYQIDPKYLYFSNYQVPR